MTAYSCSTTTHNMLAQVVDEYRDDGSKFSHAEDSCSTASHPRSCNDSPYKSYDSSISTRVVPSLCPSSSSDCNERTGELLHELELQHKGLFEDGAADVPPEWRGKTSVMIRNIAYNCFEEMLRDELHRTGFGGLFDSVFVPLNVERGTSKGYAFVRFFDASTAYEFKERFDGRKMDISGGTKRLRISPANLQCHSQNVLQPQWKHCEVFEATKLSLLQNAPIKGCDRSIFPDHRSNSPMKVLLTSRPEQRQQLLCCHQCKNHVLSRSRFRQWCGIAL
eukprot:TRINITY_DN10501_c0_g2_i3.p1 TRINITY_DN10501_c0_g2~~TRINITY_DN10501_c0_g2_i3.p1  ORF type:complete len:291 (-),score=26.91 TRINITY_DN10501_c0_g2_i3:360-1193(-)